MLIRRDAVIASVRRMETSMLHDGYALADAVDAAFDKPCFGMIRVALRGFAERVSILKAYQCQPALRAEIHFMSKVDHGGVDRSDLGRACDEHGIAPPGFVGQFQSPPLI